MVGKYFFRYFPLMDLLCGSPCRFANQYAFSGSTLCILKSPSQLEGHLPISPSLELTDSINLLDKISYFEPFSLDSLVVGLSYFIFLNQHKVESLHSSIVCRFKFHHHGLTVLLRSKVIFPGNS